MYPGQSAGTIHVPPSKSLAHRAIICAALSSGTSTISNLDYSDDIVATISCMRTLGASITEIHTNELGRKTIQVVGITDIHDIPSCELNCQESGSTLRFLIPITAISGSDITFIGENRLLHRPQSVYKELFKQHKLTFFHSTKRIKVQGPLGAGTFSVNGDVSSQFISGLLFTLPLCKDDSSLTVTLPFESKSYVDLTLEMLRTFGISIFPSEIMDDTGNCVGWHYHIPGNQKYVAANHKVEGDYSQLAFFAVLGAINHDVTCTGVSSASLQGDRAVIAFLEQCGAVVTASDDSYSIRPGELVSARIDVNDCPDLGPILMVLGMYAKEEICLVNTSRLRMKESDRIEAMVDGLRKLGVHVSVRENELNITPRYKDMMHDHVVVSGYKDHRIVMSFAIAATMYHCPITITDANAISKSYPKFWSDLQSLGIKVMLHD